MTPNELLKAKVNEVLDISEQFLKRNDHENYQKCMLLIASMMYEYYEENTLEVV